MPEFWVLRVPSNVDPEIKRPSAAPTDILRVPGLAARLSELRAQYPDLTEAALARILRLPDCNAAPED